MADTIQNELSSIRQSRGIGAAELARLVGVSRQTIYAIESGAYVPNTSVSLRLAKVLEVTVEEIFRLPADEALPEENVRAEILSSAPVAAGTSVRLCEVGNARIAVPAGPAPYYLMDSDAVVTKLGRAHSAETLPFSGISSNRLALAGCDPAIGLLAAQVAREEGVELVTAAASSRRALKWLREGKVHIAGAHLRDPESGEFNLPYLRREVAGEDLAVVTFAHWEEGWLTAAGNPLGIRRLADVAKRGVRFINREPGSGSRALFDRLLTEDGMKPAKISGAGRLANGHLAAAYAVSMGEADCCIATGSAARAFGLGFVPLQSERFDLILRRRDLSHPGVQSLLGVLQKASFRRKLEQQAGYETRRTGTQLA